MPITVVHNEIADYYANKLPGILLDDYAITWKYMDAIMSKLSLFGFYLGPFASSG